MFNRMPSRRRSRFSHVRTNSAVEALEDKRLLSGTNGVEVETQNDDTAESRLIFTAREDATTGGYSLTFEEIRRVGDEIWTLSKLRRPTGPVTLSLETVEDTVSVEAPNLPIRNFRIGGVLSSSADEFDHVDSLAEFYNRIGDTETELLYSRVDPELNRWRRDVEAEIIAKADVLYSELYGTETEGWNWWWNARPMPGIEFLAVEDAGLAVGDRGAANASLTNVQVTGVDEADIVETDGQYLYTISGQDLVIVSAATTESESAVVSRTKLAASPIAMFLQGDRLTVISREYDYGSIVPFGGGLIGFIDRVAPVNARTVVTVLDISDRLSPKLAQETIVDGEYQGARAIGDQVYVVITNNNLVPYVPGLSTIYDTSLESDYRYETRSEYLQRVDLLVHGRVPGGGLAPPSVYRRAEDGEDGLQRLGWLNGAETAISEDGGQLTSVLQFDASDPEHGPVDNISIQTRSYSQVKIYADHDAIYLVTQEYVPVDSAVNEFGNAILPAPSELRSRIDKIGIGPDGMVLEGNGSVPGFVESQFSIDEHNGYLRIVTTTERAWWNDEESANNLFVLQDVGDELVIVGSILGLAPRERIYSARFDGDRGWMVTFRQVDPVFSFDLSDPTNPRVVGELKIPGYSDHLQLIDENHLLAIGRNATAEGRLEGIHVSLFDVSDSEQPELLHRYTLNDNRWGYSEALSDHLAFNYLPGSQILAIPFSGAGDRLSFFPGATGLLTLKIDIENGIELLGTVEPSSYAAIRRSVQIEDQLYAVSSDAIEIVNLSDPDTIIQHVDLLDEEVPWKELENLPHIRFDGSLRIREYIPAPGEDPEVHVKVAEDPAGQRPNGEEIVEYEFRVMDRQDGTERLRQRSADGAISLRDGLGSLLDAGTYEFQVRTKTNRLENPEFGAWSTPEALSVGTESAQMISDATLKFGRRMLQWSRIADQVVVGNGTGSARLENPVDHYEVWVNDAATSRKVLWQRDVAGTELNLDLPDGRYFAWFRAVYQDDTQGDWSTRQGFQILGRKLVDLFGPGNTANASPQIAFPELADAVSFDVEVTAPDGATAVYTAAELIGTRHRINDTLAPGTYTLRVRANLSSNVPTEWSDPIQFTIVGRPQVNVSGPGFSWAQNGAAATEVWVNKAGTKERVFHDTNIELGSVPDALETFGLDTEYLAGYDVWVRLTMPDGSKTAWSPKAALHVQLAAQVEVNPVSTFANGADQTITWNDGTGIESFEVYVQRIGQPGAFRRVADITELRYQFTEKLPDGNYRAWVRGKLVNGLYTIWGNAHSFAVENRPVVTVAGGVVSWVSTVAGNGNATQYEIWVNQVDDSGSPLATKVVHETDLVANSYDLSSLPLGKYSVWLRSITTVGEQIFRSVWSHRVNVESTATVDVAAAFNDGIDLVLSALDQV